MSLVRGALLSGNFRTHHQLIGVSDDDQRNILIVELGGRTNQPGTHFKKMDTNTLAGTGILLNFLRSGKIRTDAQLKTISDDDQRNIMIIEIDGQTHSGKFLQGLSNMELVLFGLGKLDNNNLKDASPPYIRGVLLAGKFRTHHELNKMSFQDQRNTLIVELANHTNQSNFKSFDDFNLAGAGALLVFLSETKIRTYPELKTLSIDDMRNIMIVEIDGQTHLGHQLQRLSNMELVRIGLGVDPETLLNPPPPPPH